VNSLVGQQTTTAVAHPGLMTDEEGRRLTAEGDPQMVTADTTTTAEEDPPEVDHPRRETSAEAPLKTAAEAHPQKAEGVLLQMAIVETMTAEDLPMTATVEAHLRETEIEEARLRMTETAEAHLRMTETAEAPHPTEGAPHQGIDVAPRKMIADLVVPPPSQNDHRTTT